MTELKKALGWRVAALLDKTTIVISGEQLEELSKGDSLIILAVGPMLEGVPVPLVVPRAEVEVDAVTKYYAIAKTPQYETTVQSDFSAALLGMTNRQVFRRDSLPVNEKSLIGNPAWGNVSVGDPVVRPNDLSEFVEQLREQVKAQ